MSSDMEKYYRENGRKVFLYLMTLCGNADTAEELTQETFYRALRSVNKYKGESSVYTWLCGIARNAWLEELRKRTRHKGEELSELTEDTALRPDEKSRKRGFSHTPAEKDTFPARDRKGADTSPRVAGAELPRDRGDIRQK